MIVTHPITFCRPRPRVVARSHHHLGYLHHCQVWSDFLWIFFSADSVQAAPPTLDREGGVHKYSRAFKEIVESCLVKEPSLRFATVSIISRLPGTDNFVVQADGRAAPPNLVFQEHKETFLPRRNHTPYYLYLFLNFSSCVCLQAIFPRWPSVLSAVKGSPRFIYVARSTRGTSQRSCLRLRRPNLTVGCSIQVLPNKTRNTMY